MDGKTIIAVSIAEQLETNNRARINQEGRILEKDYKINEQSEKISNLQGQISYLQREANSLQPLTNEQKLLQEEVQELRKYKELLSKPMEEIAQKNGDFKGTYQKQQEMLAQWILSQRAYKELAMQYGKQLGKNPEQVIAESESTKEAVKNNTTEFGNGLGQKELDDLNYETIQYAEELEIEKKRKEWLRDFTSKHGLNYSDYIVDNKLDVGEAILAVTTDVNGKINVQEAIAIKKTVPTIKR